MFRDLYRLDTKKKQKTANVKTHTAINAIELPILRLIWRP